MTDLITVEGGPERFFRVSRPTADGEVISSSLPAGPWLNGPSGHPLAGALGVLIDNVAGYVLVLGRPPGGWSVSAEITLDLMRPLPSDGSVLTAQGVVRHADDVGGFASASIHVAYPRPVRVGARVRFAAPVVHLGRAFGVVRVTAHSDDNGKLFAIATVTLSP